MSQPFPKPAQWMSLCLMAALCGAGMPAQASEVVKLARLVTSGKRSAGDAPRAPAQEPRAGSGGSGTQAHGNGSNDDAGTAPAPTRGVS
ncbi:hypothetical protein [Pelomonas cellulosilytica]|uniref:Uncharacterized protein n=1 Tax=Pelomonas cellulosilytica TaxID=2906762 RepID=A0ABS8XZM4_9BURK|nr:hypothetical protein [Pelomonas sp. P8]MCE4556071.1 hypothetical protein [Pelomonas sp. P8]